MRTAAYLALSLWVCGCSFFSRSKNTVYTLDRVAPAAVVAAHGVPVAIDAVELPPGLDRKEIVVRKAGGQLDVRANELWAATLQPMVLHTLAFDLADRLPAGMVILPGEARPAGAVRAIDVAFETIAAGPESRVVLDAQWVVHQPGQPDVAHREQIALDIPSLDSKNVAAGLSQAIGALADRIAGGV